MTTDTDRVKHLEFLQNVIDRMGRNSFYVKGWSITLVAALFVLAAKGTDASIAAIAFLPAAIFWGLDGYYLRQERLFRELYRTVWQEPDSVPHFSMDTSRCREKVAGWLGVTFSRTVGPLHGAVVLTIVVVVALLRCSS